MFLTHSTLRRVPLVAFYHGVGAESGRLAGGRRGAGSQEVTRSLAVAWSWNMGLDMELDMELDMGAAPTLPLSRISRRPVEARCLYSGPEYMYTLMRARHRTCDKVLCRMYSSTKPCVLKPRAWPATYRLEPRLRLRSSNAMPTSDSLHIIDVISSVGLQTPYQIHSAPGSLIKLTCAQCRIVLLWGGL
jgi:hypothetical protein